MTATALVKYDFHLDYAHAEYGARAVFQRGTILILSDERMALWCVEHLDALTPVDFVPTLSLDRVGSILVDYVEGRIEIDGRRFAGSPAGTPREVLAI